MVCSTSRAEPDGALARALDEREWAAEKRLPMIRVELLDATASLIRHFEIDDGPTLILFRDGAETARWVGPIAVPTLVVVGSDDHLTPPSCARAMAAAIRGAELLEVPGAGHLVPLEKPALLNEKLRTFLERCAG